MKLLIIEDEERIARFLERSLMEEGYEIDLSGDGKEGYELALNNHYSAIVLDLMLPNKDGLSILSDLRSNKINTPILILTARGESHDKVHGLNEGADDYLSKPFSFDELKARIKALIRRSDPSINTILVFDDLELDTVQHVAVRNGIDIDLTTKEYFLVEYLMRNKNKVVSREEIWNQVWPEKEYTESNIIDVYIKRIRNKLGASQDAGKPLIKSVRGVGYVLGQKS